MSGWCDGALLAGDLGRNSETAILLEKFVHAYHGQLTITKDATDYFSTAPTGILIRPNTLLTISLAQLQKIATGAHFKKTFTFSMDFLHLIETLHEFTATYHIQIITKHLDTIFVASHGEVSTTKLTEEREIWRVNTATHASVWWLQNPNKPLRPLLLPYYNRRHFFVACARKKRVILLRECRLLERDVHSLQ